MLVKYIVSSLGPVIFITLRETILPRRVGALPKDWLPLIAHFKRLKYPYYLRMRNIKAFHLNALPYKIVALPAESARVTTPFENCDRNVTPGYSQLVLVHSASSFIAFRRTFNAIFIQLYFGMVFTRNNPFLSCFVCVLQEEWIYKLSDNPSF